MKICFCALILASLGGCAQMNVQVRVLNAEYLDSLPFLVARVQTVDKETRAKFAANWFDRTLHQSQERINSYQNPSIPLGERGQRLKAAEIATLSRQFDEAIRLYRQGNIATDAAREVPLDQVKDRREAYLQASSKFRAGDLVLLDTPRMLRQIQAQQEVPPGANELPAQDQDNRVAEGVRRDIEGLIGPYGLFDDGLASLVVNAPDDQWKGQFNKAFGLGSLGNTDVAVVMQNIGDFTIKGLRVDATKVTKAAFDTVEMGIKMLATAYGVPIGGGAAKTGDDAAASPDSALVAADDTRKQAEQKLRRQQSAAADVLRAIVRERASLSEDAARAEAVKRMKSVYDSNKSLLQPQTSGS